MGKGCWLESTRTPLPHFSCFFYLSSLLFFLCFLNIEDISCLEIGLIIWETFCFHFMNKVFRKISKHRVHPACFYYSTWTSTRSPILLLLRCRISGGRPEWLLSIKLTAAVFWYRNASITKFRPFNWSGAIPGQLMNFYLIFRVIDAVDVSPTESTIAELTAKRRRWPHWSLLCRDNNHKWKKRRRPIVGHLASYSWSWMIWKNMSLPIKMTLGARLPHDELSRDRRRDDENGSQIPTELPLKKQLRCDCFHRALLILNEKDST